MGLEASTQERIMEVAQELVQTRGFHAFSYRDIASAIGVKSASIHYYYPSKGDLAEALLARIRGMFEEALKTIDTDTDQPRAKLRRFMGIFEETFGAGDRLCPFCMLAMGQDTIPPAVRDQAKRFWARGEEWLVGVLEQGAQQGVLRRFEYPQAVARTVVATLEGAMVTARTFEDASRLQDAIDYLLDGLTPIAAMEEK
jgi:TetR/AcrR family transcriptional repressor of nem operon